MLIHPWDAPLDDAEWQTWLTGHDFGQLAVNGPPGEPPFVQPLHFAYDAERNEAFTHLARPNPLWHALEANPRVTLSVVDDYTFIPGPWHAPEGVPPEHGTPTSFYAAVQLVCTAHVIDDEAQKAAVLHRQLAHFQPAGDYARVAPRLAPFGRMLPGIRGIRLEVTEVRAKFKYGGNKPRHMQQQVTERLADRAAPHDEAARAHQLRRLAASG
ncbi:FMN-binding negative transcriptional regulator [Streptomyces sp. H10-C2]|uniref:FMN-binding negative transcriptional regulator n=1 Tax=unclassified Streptomyces TaxID=2593676 RepID=UPI0024BA84BE|nr:MULTISPECIES: FMN-binding negative transcriptional regulator [unclassified Streptomyces]MDJ0343100.1 FMN-binding negative transcriptional regulator [Streptomyces sp. PH10-H1]MDJ0372720.1 FMN-binding negative transcriptional regulator [Streptomyces sp. H10-C2]